jgi:hypothetical protein
VGLEDSLGLREGREEGVLVVVAELEEVEEEDTVGVAELEPVVVEEAECVGEVEAVEEAVEEEDLEEVVDTVGLRVMGAERELLAVALLLEVEEVECVGEAVALLVALGLLLAEGVLEVAVTASTLKAQVLPP